MVRCVDGAYRQRWRTFALAGRSTGTLQELTLALQAADIDALTASAPSELASGLKRLFSFLGDASADAASFAAQAREDAQRHKRAIDAESAGDSAGVATGAEGKEGVSGTPVDAGRASSEQADGAAPMEACSFADFCSFLLCNVASLLVCSVQGTLSRHWGLACGQLTKLLMFSFQSSKLLYTLQDRSLKHCGEHAA